MKNFTNATVDYKGNQVSGLILPLSIQRLDENFKSPEGYVCIGKQQFGKGLRICFIPKELKEEVIDPLSLLKEGEYYISGYTTNLQMQSAINHAIKVVKECYAKDNSENHKVWMLRTLKNNIGLNSWCNIATDILDKNWNSSEAIAINFNHYHVKNDGELIRL